MGRARPFWWKVAVGGKMGKRERSEGNLGGREENAGSDRSYLIYPERNASILIKTYGSVGIRQSEEVPYVGEKFVEELVARRVELTTYLHIEERRR